MKKKTRRKKDPTFWQKFKNSTTIRYLQELEVQKGKRELFARRWKQAYKKVKCDLSKTRKHAFIAYFNKLRREHDDTYFTKKVSIRFISRSMGYGVYALETIAPYTTLGHYTGTFKLEKEIDTENDSTFSFSTFPLFSIDAMRTGNWTRFMNHCKLRDPVTNVVAWEYYTKETPYIVFTAGSKGIKKGAQLLYSYGDEYWHETLFIGH